MRIIAILFAALFFLSASASVDTAHPCIRFDSLSKSFGKVKAGEMVGLRFHFTNCGKEPLEIEKAEASAAIVCRFPRKAVPPDSSSYVDVTFNTTGKNGPQDKFANVYLRESKSCVVLRFHGNVLPGDAVAQVPVIAGPAVKGPRLTFEKSVHDFGTVVQGEIVRYEYAFKNTGDEPLLIRNITTGCGCCVAEYPKEPIAPGKKGIVRVTLSTTGKIGQHHRAIHIESNDAPQLIHLRGLIAAPSAPSSPGR